MSAKFRTFILVMLIITASVSGAKAQQAEIDSEKLLAIKKAVPEQPPAEPKEPRKVLLFSATRGYRHEVIPFCVQAFKILGEKSGAYSAVHSEDISLFEPESLNRFDAVVLLHTSGDLFAPENPDSLSKAELKEALQRQQRLRKSLQNFVARGNGLVGIHAATLSFPSWPEFGEMLGAYFTGHPAASDAWIKVEKPDHPLNASFNGKTFKVHDEIYRFGEKAGQYCDFQYQTYSRAKLQVLLALDRDRHPIVSADRKDADCPISWVKTYKKGRVFQCSLGHFEKIYTTPAIMAHYLAGIQFALGDLEAPHHPDALPDPAAKNVRSIFNGKDLAGWDGDPDVWSVKDNAIVGEFPEGFKSTYHTYLIWDGNQRRNFQLDLMFKPIKGNSGIDYRAQRMEKDRRGNPVSEKEKKWSIRGYQADITDGWMGSLYNWQRQGAQLGRFEVIYGDEEKQLTHIGTLGGKEGLTEAGYFKPNQWNHYQITARGSHLTHRINGYLCVECVDNSALAREKGLIGFQMHTGTGPMANMFKDIYITELQENFAQAIPLLTDSDLSKWDFSTVAAKDAWSAENTTLENTKPTEGFIYTKKQYEDFILCFQYRRSSDESTGILLRSSGFGLLPRGIKIAGQADRFDQASFINHGDLPRAALVNSRFNKMPSSLWNDCEIKVDGSKLQVTVNGVRRLKVNNCPEEKGHIALSSSSGNVTYRNIVLIPID